MPNCDWGRPCDCIDCRTVYEKIKCTECGFENTVPIVRIVKGYSVDKKGVGGYDFEMPENPLKGKNCEKCGHALDYK
jgi:hypothetical protein